LGFKGLKLDPPSTGIVFYTGNCTLCVQHIKLYHKIISITLAAINNDMINSAPDTQQTHKQTHANYTIYIGNINVQC